MSQEFGVTRLPDIHYPDDRRVITRLFAPGDHKRLRSIINRVMALSEEQVCETLQETLLRFENRHVQLRATLNQHFIDIVPDPDVLGPISPERRQLIGAYFTMEYSFESAALFNPSIVRHPEQHNVGPGAIRFLMSLRATGEGHISSIVFRSGIIEKSGEIHFDAVSRHSTRLRRIEDRNFEKAVFLQKVRDLEISDARALAILNRLPEQFTFSQLHRAIDAGALEHTSTQYQEAIDSIQWLSHSNYHLELPPDLDPADVVIFPSSDTESNGIEDVRLVEFDAGNGESIYYGTYTAYNGSRILPQLLETRDFRTIKIHTLNGPYAKDKGMALFPRLIRGRYTMISRIDGENLYLMTSDNIYHWDHAEKLQTPGYPWEFIQIGNCGSPIETDAGWLLLTHGVGPMRRYCIGCSLLDLEDPSRVIAQSEEPILAPTEEERSGYVPNVVYSCGSLVHEGKLIIPYAMSDSATRFASLGIHDLLERLKP